MLKFEGTDKIRDIKYEDGYVDRIYYDNNTLLVFTSDKEKTGVDEVLFKGRKLVDVTSYGKCEQNGTPTPDAPVDIVSNNGVLKVSSQLLVNGNCKENVNNWTVTGLTYNNTDNYISFTNNKNVKIYLRCSTNNARKENHVYAYLITGKIDNGTADWGSRNAGSATTSLTTTEQTLVFIDTFPTNGNGEPWINIQAERTFTLNKKSGFRMYDLTALGLAGIITTPEQAINYFGEIYQEPKEVIADGTVETIKDSLNNSATTETLLGVGDYKDEQDIISGGVIRNVGVKVLDGTESWIYYSVSQGNIFRITIVDSVQDDKEALEVLCNSYEVVLYIQRTNGTLSGTLGYYDFINNNYTTLADWKQYLADQYAAGTPVIIVYPLRDPTTEQVLGQQLTIQQGNNTVEVTQASVDDILLKVKYK